MSESNEYPPGLPAIFEVVRRLRAPDGCPWDREQTHASLRPYLLEEAHEALEAIDAADDAKLLEELGDVLLQVAMHAEIAASEGRFDAAAVSEQVAAKMVARHPHVFGDVAVTGSEEVLANWERNKSREPGSSASLTAVERVPPSLPALAWTLGMQKRAARVGRGGPHSDAATAAAAVGQLAARASTAVADDAELAIGDLLFEVVGLARLLKVNPEDALRVRGARFRADFRRQGETG